MVHSVHAKHAEYKLQCFRLHLLISIIICFSSLLIARLAYLQIAEYKRYETLSLNNKMSIIPIAPPRGIILDRKGVILADNLPIYVLEIVPEHVKDMQKTLNKLKGVLPSLTKEEIETFNRLRYQNRSFVPIPLKLKLTEEEVARFASNQYQFPGVSIKARLMRFYPLGEMTAHLLGYVGRINVEELNKVDSGNYRATNFIGKTGIEKFYEPLLHGQVGYQQAETDVSGRTLRVMDKKNPVSGDRLYLTIDTALQQAAYQAMQGKRGAVVVIHVAKGEILAMVSSPSFNPNLFVNGISSNDYRKLSEAKDRPLFNRAIRGLYPPGSTIKPFIALAGLEKGVVNDSFGIYDSGRFKLPNSSHIYKDWKKTGHGFVNLSRAIRVSCDPYFYQLGYKIGIDYIEKTLKRFGFGRLTEVDLPEEAAGLVPGPKWKRAHKGVAWYPGDTVISSIGQGFMLASTLQLADGVATLSRKGKHFRPHLLYKFSQSDQGELSFYQPVKEKKLHLKDKTYWGIVIEAMHSVITSNEGTGYRFGRDTAYSVAAKTGTAQVFGGKFYEKRRQEDMPELLRDHSLFIAFAPVEKPEVAIAVMVENDALASKVARIVLDAYFAQKGLA